MEYNSSQFHGISFLSEAAETTKNSITVFKKKVKETQIQEQKRDYLTFKWVPTSLKKFPYFRTKVVKL